ncbi:MAG: alkyl hydroperoxide reductase [Flavobacteriales bacterium]|nr:alkyl hydroperoxide reductase [Flavobacteriales bacterium]|tara:strand:+ start:817 stop:1305 length:489 start_codon:yes stop_codon:yes gene_type:complete
MKKILLIILLVPAFVFAQQSLPSVEIKSLDNSNFNTSQFENNGNPIVISFWATWCKPCILELETINEVYEDWQDETGVKLIAISTDNIQKINDVKVKKDADGWEYEVYIDSNREFARAMNVRPIPHTFLLDGNKNIVWQHTGYSPGDEEDLFDQIKKITNNK